MPDGKPPYPGAIWIVCTVCNKKGSFECPSCDRGILLERCNKCGGSNSDCKSCNGSGFVRRRCNSCKNGVIKCPIGWWQ